MTTTARERHRRWTAAHPGRVKEHRTATYYRDLEHSRARRRDAQARYRARHPGRVRASQLTYAEARKRSARPRLPRPRCALCGGRFYQLAPGPRVCARPACREMLRRVEATGVVADAARGAREFFPCADGWQFFSRKGGVRE